MKLRAMLWEIIWEALSDQIDESHPEAYSEQFSDMDRQSSNRGHLCHTLEAELYER